MNLTDVQSRALSTLRTGEAVAFAEGMEKPVLLKVDPAKPVGAPPEDKDVARTGATAAFWSSETGVALRLPFPGCLLCPAKKRGASCRSRTAARLAPAARATFPPLFNALRFAPDLSSKAFLDFRTAALRSLASAGVTIGDQSTPYCLFVELAEDEIERRGAHGVWPHQAVATLLERAGRIFLGLDALNSAAGMDLRRKAAHDSDLAAFSAELGRLQRVAHAPFAGCTACARACTYRFDAERPGADAVVAAFRRDLSDTSVDDAAVFSHCREAAAGRVHPDDRESARGAAVCFAVQQVAALDWPADQQRGFARWLADQLKAEDDANP
jgi:hypothetical protein